MLFHRHHSSSLDKKGLIRRESTMGFSRMLSMTGAPRRGSSAEKNKISSFANLVGMKQRAHVIVKEDQEQGEIPIIVLCWFEFVTGLSLLGRYFKANTDTDTDR